MHRSKLIDGITLTLTIVGAINWGLVGLFGFNLVSLATNHSMDGGIKSAKKSAEWWEKQG